MLKKYDVILLNLAIALANFWIWRVLKEDLLLGFILILLSIVLSYLSFIRFNLIFYLFLIILALLISYKVLIFGFDGNFKTLSSDRKNLIDDRHWYFAVSLGELFQNKYVLRFYKDVNPYLNVYAGNIFNSLSPNLYFFANHPREREKVQEFPMYPAIFAIPFFVGLIIFISHSYYLITGYLVFTLLITGFISQDYIYGPILMMPLINMLITLGLKNVYIYLRKNEI